MATRLSASGAVTRVQLTDTSAFGLGPGQPPAFLKALGERDDWQDLRIGCWGPVERALRAGRSPMR